MKYTKCLKTGKSNEPLTYTEVTNNFADNTNCHAIGSIKRSESALRKSFWIILFLTGAALTIHQIYEIFETYFSYPVSINVNVTYEKSLVFPTIAICNYNMVRKSQLGLMKGSEALDLLTYTVGGDPDMSQWENSEGRAELRHKFLNSWSQLNESSKAAQGHQIEEMLLDCSYNEKRCYPDDFTHFFNPKFGNCYMFNSNWKNQNVQVSHQPGPFYGLKLELFINQDEYIPELTESAGVVVTVHDQDVMPFPEEDGVLITPDVQSNVAMVVEKIQRMPSPYPSDCLDVSRKEAYDYSAYSELYPVRYTHHACYRTCLQAHLFKECNCGDPAIPMEGTALYNLVDDKENIRKVCTQDQQKCMEKVHQKYLNNELKCNCSVACVDTIFEKTVSTLQWPNTNYEEVFYNHLAKRNPQLQSIMKSHSEKGTNPGNHLVKLLIYYSEFNFKAIEESASYPMSTLLSNLGGSISFYLGMSVVAAFELLEYLFDLLLVACNKSRDKKEYRVKPNDESRRMKDLDDREEE